jgi:hypothetical protein
MNISYKKNLSIVFLEVFLQSEKYKKSVSLNPEIPNDIS